MAARTRNIFEAIIQNWVEGQIEEFDENWIEGQIEGFDENWVQGQIEGFDGVRVKVQSRKNQQHTQVDVIFSQFWIWYFESKTLTS